MNRRIVIRVGRRRRRRRARDRNSSDYRRARSARRHARDDGPRDVRDDGVRADEKHGLRARAPSSTPTVVVVVVDEALEVRDGRHSDARERIVDRQRRASANRRARERERRSASRRVDRARRERFASTARAHTTTTTRVRTNRYRMNDDGHVDAGMPARGRDARSSTKMAETIRRRSGQLLKSAKKPRAVMRRAVTGNAETRVRDYVKIPRVIRQIDKMSFCAGVYGLMMTEYIATRVPERFWMFYAVAMPLIFAARGVYYRMIRWQYFLYDLCYFANVTALVFLTVKPKSAMLFRCVFAFANGPVLLAIPLWRNSLVFHSVDKVQSVFVHAMPCLMTWCGRWFGFGDDVGRMSAADLNADVSVVEGCVHLMVYPMFAYLFWQALYLVKTEYMDKGKLDKDPELMTSLRWLASDRKSSANKFALRMMRKIGLFGEDEFFDAGSTKTKFVFVMLQLGYTIITFIPIPLCYSNYYAHTALMWIAFGSSVYNGAVYYIDVFSRRYVERLQIAEEFERERSSSMNAEEFDRLIMTPID